MRIKPLKFKPLKMKPIRLSPIAKPPIIDSDYDTVPDHLDCNPRNPYQQDNGRIKTTDDTYFPPEGSDEPPTVLRPEEPRQTFRSTLQQKGSEEDLMKKAKKSYDVASGEDVYLFIKKRDGRWIPTKKFTAQQFDDLGYESHRYAQEILKNPTYTDYKFTTDQYFPQRQQVEQQQTRQREKQLSTYKQNIQQSFAGQPSDEEKKRIAMDRQAYAQGPSMSALYKSRSFLQPRRSAHPSEQQSVPSRTGGEDYSSSQKPVYDLEQAYVAKPLGYQEQSRFPMHVPYRPTKAGFVKGAPKKPLFKPPFLRRI